MADGHGVDLPALPLVDLIPAPREVVSASFNVADRIVDGQRRLAERFVDAIAPVTAKLMPWTNGKRKASGKPSEGKAVQVQAA